VSPVFADGDGVSKPAACTVFTGSASWTVGVLSANRPTATGGGIRIGAGGGAMTGGADRAGSGGAGAGSERASVGGAGGGGSGAGAAIGTGRSGVGAASTAAGGTLNAGVGSWGAGGGAIITNVRGRRSRGAVGVEPVWDRITKTAIAARCTAALVATAVHDRPLPAPGADRPLERGPCITVTYRLQRARSCATEVVVCSYVNPCIRRVFATLNDSGF
jgi:hypothetical protein